jgi:hypothetical protein
MTKFQVGDRIIVVSVRRFGHVGHVDIVLPTLPVDPARKDPSPKRGPWYGVSFDPAFRAEGNHAFLRVSELRLWPLQDLS